MADDSDLRAALLPGSPAMVPNDAASINSSVRDGTAMSDFAEGATKPAKDSRVVKHDLSADRAATGFFELFRFADGTDKVLLVVGAVSSIAAGALMPGLSLVFGKLLDSFTDVATLLDSVTQYSIDFCYIGVAALVLSYGQFACFQIASERQIARIRERFLAALLKQDMGWFDVNQAGDVSSRLAEDTVVMQNGMGEKLGFTVSMFSQFAFGIGLAFYYGWLLTVVLIGFVPVLGVVASLLVMTLSKTSKASQDAYAKASTVATEAISAIRIVVAFSGERQEVKRYSDNLSEAERQGILKGRATGIAIGIIMYGVGLWFGTWLIIRSQNKYIFHTDHPDPDKVLTGGEVITIFFSIVMAGIGLASGAPNLGLFAAARAAAARIYDIIALEPALDPTSEGGLRPTGALQGRIEFKNIHFSYPSRPDTKILDNFSLTIEPGSGKSTVVSLLQRFYSPASGSVCVDGHDVTELNLAWLRAHIGVVSQEPALFADSIADNIAYGVTGLGGDPSHADIVSAAKMANAHHFITRFPDGYDTLVGERGAQLSGGQKQRVSIARAMLRNPPILLLDEATSALDTKSERVVQQALDALIADGSSRTTIVIAHRLSTVKNADQIVVMDHGRIVEVGTHAELMAKEDGKYRIMHDLQSLGTEGEEEQEGVESKAEDLDALDESAVVDTRTPVYPSKEMIGTPEEDTNKPKPSNGFSRVFAYQRPERCTFIVATAAACVNGCIMPMFAIVFSAMTNLFYSTDHGAMRSKSMEYLIIYVVIGAVCLFSYFFQIWGYSVVGEKLTTRLRKHAYQSLMRQDVGFFDLKENSTGKLTSRLSGDTALVRATTGDRVGVLVQNNVSVVAAMIIAFYSCWQLALVVLATFPALVLAGYLQVRMTQETVSTAGQGKQSFQDAGGYATESLRAIRTVTAFGLQDLVLTRFKDALQEPRRKGIIRGHAGGVGLGLSKAVIFGAYALSFYYGAVLIRHNHTTFEGMMRVFYALSLAGTGVGQNSSYTADQNAAKEARESIFRLIDRESKVDASLPVGIRPLAVRGHIEFVHVTFSYPARPDQPVLRDFNLTIPAGTTAALVGPSGSGKSTVIALLQRYYDPDGGTVLLDGVDLRNYNVRWLRSYMGLVSQEPALFDDTIEYNVAYGRTRLDEPFGELGETSLFGATPSKTKPSSKIRSRTRSRRSTGHSEPDVETGLLSSPAAGAGRSYGIGHVYSPHLVPEDISSACRTSNAAHFISELDHGYQTRTGDQGTQMSGGQKQRIAIARAVVRNPKLLLLDEATSALDTHSEAIVQSALNALLESHAEQRTSIVIAHRLSTVRNADCIVVVSAGRVVETGRHDDLIHKSDGYYRALCRAQES